MGFSDPETAPTISLSRSYRLQKSPRCFGCAGSPMSPEPKALSPALTSLQGWPSWPIPRYSESCKWRQSHDLVNLSYGSGPGGRWFKSTRPDQTFGISNLRSGKIQRAPGAGPGCRCFKSISDGDSFSARINALRCIFNASSCFSLRTTRTTAAVFVWNFGSPGCP
jgi:hypothetical protein